MSFFGSLFGGDKPTTENIQKQVTRIKERYAQPEYRRAAMDRLLAWGTPEALEAVMQRFSMVSDSIHWDQEEKKWLIDELIQRGDAAREATIAYLSKNDNIAFAAKALVQLAGKNYVPDLMRALKAKSPDDYRSVDGKADLITALVEANDPQAIPAIIPHLDDHGDDVQVVAVQAIEKLTSLDAANADDRLAAHKKLVAILFDDTRPVRVLLQTAKTVSTMQITIGDKLGTDKNTEKKGLAEALQNNYVIINDLLQRR